MAITLFVAAVVLMLIGGLFYWYLRDITQKKHAVLRNFPIIGHLRYFFENLGEYFRQYFFANDREEMPFNRATRGWSYGQAVTDPRTGEIIKGMVVLGSLRARQDIQIFQALVGAGELNSGGPNDPVRVALDRLAQLGAFTAAAP